MADNTTLNAGTGGDVIATDDIAGVKYQIFKLGHGLADVAPVHTSATNPLPISGPVTGTFFQATQPVSMATNTPDVTDRAARALGTIANTAFIANAGTNLNTSALALDATLTGGTQKAIARGGAKGTAAAGDITSNPVDANTQALHVNLAGTNAVNATLTAETTKVIGTVNIAAAQTLATVTAVTAITNALPVGANVIGKVSIDQSTPGVTNLVTVQPSTLAVTVTAAANTAATATLAAVAGQFHYITGIEIMRTATAALAGTATLVVTTTNLPGGLAWSFGNAMAAGGTQCDLRVTFENPLKSSVVNTATTIVMPAPGAAVLWRANVYYFTAA